MWTISSVKNWGNSLAVRIPAGMAQNLDWLVWGVVFVEKAPYEVLEQTRELIETLLGDPAA